MLEKNNMTKSVLGKGLASLIPTVQKNITQPNAAATDNSEQNKDRHLGISMCKIEDIYPNPYQPRRVFDDASIVELANSIKQNGLIQPLIVRKTVKGFELIAGERRWRAAKSIGIQQVPIVIRRSTDKETLELAIVENIQREDLNCIDSALAYQQLMNDFHLTQEQVAEKVGKERATIANHIRLLKLSPEVQNNLKTGRLSFGHGRALLGIENTNELNLLAKECIEKNISVRALEEKIQGLKAANKENNIKNENNNDPIKLRLKNLSKEISNRVGTRVSIKGNDAKGRIVIDYFNRVDLDKVLEKLLK